jgi:hypothetical protein
METTMDKKIAGLLGAAAALASLNGAQAATPPDPTEVLKARSYADLLRPIPNAMAVLEAVDRAVGDPDANVQVAQFYVEHHHHHHHHHNSYYRRGYRDEPRVVVVPRERRFYRDHHHHHHHHNSYYRRYRED